MRIIFRTDHRHTFKQTAILLLFQSMYKIYLDVGMIKVDNSNFKKL